MVRRNSRHPSQTPKAGKSGRTQVNFSITKAIGCLKPIAYTATSSRFHGRQVYPGLLLSWLILLIVLPQLNLAFAILNAVASILIMALRLYSSLLPPKPLSEPTIETEPFVSIHVPTHNEPPDLVIRTLHALNNLDYGNFEVIVLDNNTEAVDLWQPVKQACKRLGTRFKFRHIENMQGYKAGALNICNEMSHPKTEFILVIDADYCVRPELLLEALGHFSDNSVGLVQFPQSYRNTSITNLGMHREYDHFFEVYMNMANHFNCVLSTGTVSIIRRQVLREVGGWSGSTITEDCELGLRMCQKGYRGVYVPKPLGKGLMPTDLESIKVQRERWVFGNMQTLYKFIRLPKSKLSFVQCLGITTQLTAWFNFLMIAMLAAISGAFGLLLSPGPVYYAMLIIGLLSIWLYLTGEFIFFCLAFRRRVNVLKNATAAYMAHLGMAWEGATSWLRFICGENLRFKRTNKFLIPGKNSYLTNNLIFTVILIATGFPALISGLYIECALAWLAAPAFASVFSLRALTTRTYALTQGMDIANIAD